MTKKHAKILLFMSFTVLIGCSQPDGKGNIVGPITTSSSSQEPISSSSAIVIDYSLGQAMNARIGKGINMGNTFDATCESCWGAGPIELYQIEEIASKGFNSIRLPVRWDGDAEKASPYTIDPVYLARVKEVVGWINANNLVAIINIHHHESFRGDTLAGGVPNPANENMHIERIVAIWQQIAAYFADVDNNMLAFEILNEPVYGISRESHNKIITQTHPIIRATNPGRTLMYGTYPWNSFSGLAYTQLPADGNIIFTPHYYQPAAYALQGENYQCPEDTTIWEGTSVEKQKMKEDFDKIISLANQHYPGGLPINIGEFGATACGGISSRVRWTKHFVSLAAERGFSWNYWGFANVGGYELFDKDTKVWETQTLDALLK
jgi:endoglucanase